MKTLQEYITESQLDWVNFKDLSDSEIEKLGKKYYRQWNDRKLYPENFFIHALLKAKEWDENFDFNINDFEVQEHNDRQWLENIGYQIFFNIPVDVIEECGGDIKKFEKEYGKNFAQWIDISEAEPDEYFA